MRLFNRCLGSLFALFFICLFADQAAAYKPDTSPKPSAFLGDSNRFAAVDSMQSAAIYDAKTGAVLHKLPTAGVGRSLAVTTDHQFLCIGCGNGSISVWDTATGTKIWEVPTEGYLYEVNFAWDGKRLVACTAGGAVVYDTATGKQIGAFGSDRTFSAALSPDGSKGVLVGLEKRLFTFDIATNKTTDTGLTAVHPVRYSSDGKHVVCVTRDSTLRVFTMGEKIVEKDLSDLSPSWVKSIAKGAFFISCRDRGVIFSPETNEVKELCKTPPRGDVDESNLVGVDTTFNLITSVTDLQTGKVLFTINNRANYREGGPSFWFHASMALVQYWPCFLATALALLLLSAVVIHRRFYAGKTDKPTH